MSPQRKEVDSRVIYKQLNLIGLTVGAILCFIGMIWTIAIFWGKVDLIIEFDSQARTFKALLANATPGMFVMIIGFLIMWRYKAKVDIYSKTTKESKNSNNRNSSDDICFFCDIHIEQNDLTRLIRNWTEYLAIKKLDPDKVKGKRCNMRGCHLEAGNYYILKVDPDSYFKALFSASLESMKYDGLPRGDFNKYPHSWRANLLDAYHLSFLSRLLKYVESEKFAGIIDFLDNKYDRSTRSTRSTHERSENLHGVIPSPAMMFGAIGALFSESKNKSLRNRLRDGDL